MSERLAIGFRRAVYIQVVGIDGSDHGHVGCEMVERTVVLIRLDHHEVAVFLQQQVRAIVHTDSAEERVRAQLRLIQQMRQHGAGGRLAVRTGYAERFHLTRHQAQHLRPLEDVVTLLAQIDVQRAVVRNGRCAHHQRVAGGVRGEMRNEEGRGFIVGHTDALCLQFVRQGRRRTVIAGYGITAVMEIARKGAHSYAADTQEKDILYITLLNHRHINTNRAQNYKKILIYAKKIVSLQPKK